MDGGKCGTPPKQDLAEYHGQIHDCAGTTPLLDVVRTVHDEIAKMLSAREQLRVQKSAITRFLRLTGVMTAQTPTERVHDRLEDIAFHEETSLVILRQLKHDKSGKHKPE